MRVTFVLPGIWRKPCGGAKIVFEYANRLAARGHEVSIVFWVGFPSSRLGETPLPGWCKRLAYRVMNAYYPRWFSLDRRVNKVCAFAIDEEDMPDSDWVFATAVETAEPVAKLPSSKGNKGYMVQDFESWSLSEEEVCATYRLGMANVVISKWLEGIVEREAPGTTTLISNPVDTSVFYDDGLGRDPSQVSVLYSERPHKGFDDAFRALLLAKERIPSLHVEAFGVYPRPDSLPDWFGYTMNATPDQLRRIYSGSAAYVCASTNEGFGLTGLEALACGSALASTGYQGVYDYAVDGENSLLSPVGDPSALSDNLVSILEDQSLRERLGAQGSRDAKARSWESAADAFEHLIFNGAGFGGVTS